MRTSRWRHSWIPAGQRLGNGGGRRKQRAAPPAAHWTASPWRGLAVIARHVIDDTHFGPSFLELKRHHMTWRAATFARSYTVAATLTPQSLDVQVELGRLHFHLRDFRTAAKAGTLEVFVPSEGRVAPTGLGSVTRQNDRVI